MLAYSNWCKEIVHLAPITEAAIFVETSKSLQEQTTRLEEINSNVDQVNEDLEDIAVFLSDSAR